MRFAAAAPIAARRSGSLSSVSTAAATEPSIAGDHEPGLSGDMALGHARRVAHNRRKPERHSLEHGIAHALPGRSVDEEGRAGKQRSNIAAVAPKSYALADAAACGCSLEVSARRAVAYDPQLEAGMLRGEPRRGFDQHVLALVAQQTPNRNKYGTAAYGRNIRFSLRCGHEGLPIDPILERDEAALAGDRRERARDSLGDAAELAVGRVEPAQQLIASHRFGYAVDIEKADPVPRQHRRRPCDKRGLDAVHDADAGSRPMQQCCKAQLQKRQQREQHQHFRPCALTRGDGKRDELMPGEPRAGTLKQRGAIGVAVDEGEMLLDPALRLGGEIASKLVLAAVCAVGAHQMQHDERVRLCGAGHPTATASTIVVCPVNRPEP